MVEALSFQQEHFAPQNLRPVVAQLTENLFPKNEYLKNLTQKDKRVIADDAEYLGCVARFLRLHPFPTQERFFTSLFSEGEGVGFPNPEALGRLFSVVNTLLRTPSHQELSKSEIHKIMYLTTEGQDGTTSLKVVRDFKEADEVGFRSHLDTPRDMQRALEEAAWGGRRKKMLQAVQDWADEVFSDTVGWYTGRPIKPLEFMARLPSWALPMGALVKSAVGYETVKDLLPQDQQVRGGVYEKQVLLAHQGHWFLENNGQELMIFSIPPLSTANYI